MVIRNRSKLVFSDNTIEILNGDPTVTSILIHIVKSGKCSIPPERIQLFADGVELDMLDLSKRLSTLVKDPKCILIGRRKISPFLTSNKLAEEQRDLHGCFDSVKECPRIRGYTGFVPGKQFGYGMGEFQIDNEHQKPAVDIEKDAQTHEHPCQGYDGHIRGMDHVAGRTWQSVIHDINEFDFEELVTHPFIPEEIPAYRSTQLEDTRPSILKLITPPTSPVAKPKA